MKAIKFLLIDIGFEMSC